ncbi:MAG: class I SAM-dependent methyltransferase [Bacteroidia bacterium]
MDWFGSDYYLKLYKNRNHKEAEQFLDTLLNYLDAPKSSRVIDVCCGRGRHSIYLSKMGYQVLGIDAAEKSIEYAQKYEQPNLRFKVKNILSEFADNEFDLALNVFTSFGYFNNDSDSFESLNNIGKGLKPNGQLIIDYLNQNHVVKNLKPADNILIDGVEYDIKRWADNRFIRKEIKVVDGQAQYIFNEQVRRFDFNDFSKMLLKAGFKVKATFGDYGLHKFEYEQSSRLIIHAVKQ